MSAIADPLFVPVLGLLGRVRRRIRAAFAVALLEALLPWIAGAALLLVLAARVVPWGFLQPMAVLVAVVPVVGIVVRALTVPIGDDAVARAADRRLGSHDALSSALQFRDLGGEFGDRIRARADAVARTADAREAVPIGPRWRRFLFAGAIAALALAVAVTTAQRVDVVSAAERERAALAAEAESLREEAASLRDDPAASPDRESLAQRLEQLAEDLEHADDLDAGLAELERARSEIEATVGDEYLAEKSAVQGLDRSLAAEPLSSSGGDAASQLESLAAELADLSADEREAIADRLQAAAATQSAGSPATASALGAAADALSAGDLAGAAAALDAAAAAQRDAEGSVADQTARLDAADAISDAASRAAQDGEGQGDAQGQGTGQGTGQGQGIGQGQGQVTGQGQGQGQGNGSGRASGQVTGAQGGTGSGQGGQGRADGSGTSTESGNADSPTIWLPGGDSDELQVDGTSTSGDTETVGQGQAISTASGARVPVDDIITTYRDEAIESLDRGRVPPSAREMVRRYFDAISGG